MPSARRAASAAPSAAETVAITKPPATVGRYRAGVTAAASRATVHQRPVRNTATPTTHAAPPANSVQLVPAEYGSTASATSSVATPASVTNAPCTGCSSSATNAVRARAYFTAYATSSAAHSSTPASASASATSAG